MNSRFTVDGSDTLELQLAAVCEAVAAEVQDLLPSSKLEALVLGGGYGRGEGGVLLIPGGEHPYNDLEFYVFMRGHRLLNQRRYNAMLRESVRKLSLAANIHIEFKIDSLPRWRHDSISMFSYDLVAGHKVLAGVPEPFRGCEHHLISETIPLAEATRLLFNRCTGLLLAREILARTELSPEDKDFVGRNIAKAQLALGDAFLTALGRYHWSCRQRHAVLASVLSTGNSGARSGGIPSMPWVGKLLALHGRGVAFKLHPHRSPLPSTELREYHREAAALALEVWLWVESRRLDQPFGSAAQYCASHAPKCNGPPAWKNCLLNLSAFGAGALLDSRATRYPRERLLDALALLLWEEQASGTESWKKTLQHRLHTRASDFAGLVAAYKEAWPAYG